MEIVFIVGRVLFGGYFLMNGFNHFMNVSSLTGYASSKKVPMPKISVIATGVLLLLGGLSIVLGIYVSIGMWMLIIFLIPTTFMMHAYWEIQDPMARMGEQINFTKNIALVGALLMLVALTTPWVAGF